MVKWHVKMAGLYFNSFLTDFRYSIFHKPLLSLAFLQKVKCSHYRDSQLKGFVIFS